jgi:hypothetical protein
MDRDRKAKMTQHPETSTTVQAMLAAMRSIMVLHDRLEVDLKNQKRMDDMRLTEDEVLSMAHMVQYYTSNVKGPYHRAELSAQRKIDQEAHSIIDGEQVDRRAAQEAKDLAYLKGEIR